MSEPVADQTVVALKKLHVLYVEDSPDDAELCLRDLKKAAFVISADVVATRDDFREKLRSNTYDVILSDYRLPNWSGMDALEMAQQHARETPFILVAGALGEQAIVECMQRGATDYVLKDRTARLPTVIRRAVEAKQLRQDHARAEAALCASESRYRRLFETAKDGILILDAQTGEINDVNPFLQQLLGYSRLEFLGGQLWDFGFFKDKKSCQEAFRTLQEVEYIRYDDLPLQAKNGKRVDVEFVSNVYWGDGLMVIQCNIRDMTERKRARESVVKLRKAVDTSGEVIFMTDREGFFTFVNAEFTRLYGYTEEEVVGKTTPRVLKSGNRSPEEYASYWKTILDERVTKNEWVNKTRDGRLVTMEESANPILDEQGNIKGFLSIQRDVTERRQLELQLVQSQKMEAVGRLAGGVAHDFNNLLTIITGYSELLLEGTNSADPARASLKEIKKAGERAAALTRQLLAFSRQQVLAPRVLDLSVAVADMEKMLRRLIGEDIDLVTSSGANLGRVRADPGQIEQVILNLAVNARDAMPDGGKLIIESSNIDLDESYAQRNTQVAPGPYVMLAVTDTGSGMDKETQARIFEPFFTTKEQGKGTGLGLATVYGIVKQSGGFIWVYSELGQGTSFKIYLPRIEDIAATVELLATRRAPPRGSETILVVEDEVSLRLLIGKVLGANGYTVLAASGGEEALGLCSNQPGTIHLMLTDVVMPQMNGRELAKRIASLRPETKILYMSGYTDTAIVHRGALDEGTPFLQKPFTPDALARKVREVLAA